VSANRPHLAEWAAKGVLPALLVLLFGLLLLAVLLESGAAHFMPAMRAAAGDVPQPAGAFTALSAMLLLFVAGLGSAALGRAIIGRALPDDRDRPRHRRVAWRLGGLALAVTAIAAVVIYLYLFPALEDQLIAQCGIGSDPWESLKSLRNLAGVAGTVGLLGGTALLFATACLQRPLPQLPDKGKQDEKAENEEIQLRIAELTRRVGELKSLLFVAAALLFTGLAQLSSWYELALARDAGCDAGYRGFTNALVQYLGFLYALVLAAVFVPSALWIRLEANALADRKPGVASDPEARADWLEHHGLRLNLPEQAKRAGAIVTPLLAAPAIDWLGKLVTVLGELGLN